MLVLSAEEVEGVKVRIGEKEDIILDVFEF